MDMEAQDRFWMEHALELARRGIGLASPNPEVGCVLVDRDGQKIGEGWHEYDRRAHAEAAAIEDARRNAPDRLRGSTAYVTLEPCNHTGRTSPCTQALISSGVGRVVAATADPNPGVAGNGIQTLLAACIETRLGVCEVEARRLNEPFARWIQHKRPFVTLKVAMFMDGRIAPPESRRTPGEPYCITGEEARQAVQMLRWQSDAVLTGIGTVLADDPLLTDRSRRPRRRPLLRVVLDSALRTPLECKLVSSARQDVLIFTLSKDMARADQLSRRGVRVEVLESDSRQVPIAAVLERLGAEGILSVLTESGTCLNTALLTGGFVDRSQFFLSPQVIGSGGLPAFADLDAPVLLSHPDIAKCGPDFSVTSLLRDPWPTLA